MNAQLDWKLVYEARDRFGQIIDSEYEVKVKAENRMAAMLLAVDKVLDETKAENAVCRRVERV